MPNHNPHHIADMLRRIKLTDYHTAPLHSVWLLEGLEDIPVYATAMQRLGFVQIIKDLSFWHIRTDALVARLEVAAENSVDA